jgi:hypothetical protein
VPFTVTIAEGQLKATFTIITKPVAANTPVTIAATHSGATETANLTIVPTTRRSVPSRKVN